MALDFLNVPWRPNNVRNRICLMNFRGNCRDRHVRRVIPDKMQFPRPVSVQIAAWRKAGNELNVMPEVFDSSESVEIAPESK